MSKLNLKDVRSLFYCCFFTGVTAAVSFYVHSNEETTKISPPAGYIKVNSKQVDNVVTHEFQKPAPQRAEAKQTAPAAMSKYQQSVPPSMALEAKEFETLWRNRQNMQMFTEIAQMEAAFEEAKAKAAEYRSVTAEEETNRNGNDVEAFVSAEPGVSGEAKEAETATGMSDIQIEQQVMNELDMISLDGIYKANDKYVATLTLAGGKSVDRYSNSVVTNGINITVERDHIVLSKKEKHRTIPLVR